MSLLALLSLGGGLAFALTMLLCRLFRRALRPSARYALLLLPLVLFWTPLGLEMHRYTQMPVSPPAYTDEQPETDIIEAEPVEQPPETGPLPARQRLAQTLSAAPAPRLPVGKLLFALWAVGAAGLALHQLWSRFWFFRSLRRLRETPDEKTQAAFQALRPPRRARLYQFRGAASPFTVGTLSPQIWVPERGLDEDGLAYALAHELTHVRRFDLARRGLFHLTAIVHWFNPLAWLMLRANDRLCELSCDERVTRGLDERGKKAYGRTLLLLMQAGRSALPACMAGRPTDTEMRLKTMLHLKKPTRLSAATSLALAAALVCTSAAAAAYTSRVLSNGDGYWTTNALSVSDYTGETGAYSASINAYGEDFTEEEMEILQPDGSFTIVKVGQNVNLSADFTVKIMPSDRDANPDPANWETRRYEIETKSIDRMFNPEFDASFETRRVQGHFSVKCNGETLCENGVGYLTLPAAQTDTTLSNCFSGVNDVIPYEPTTCMSATLNIACTEDALSNLDIYADFSEERKTTFLLREPCNDLTQEQWSAQNLYKYGLRVDTVKYPDDIGLAINSSSFSGSHMYYNTRYNIGTIEAYMNSCAPGENMDSGMFCCLVSDQWQGMWEKDGKTAGRFKVCNTLGVLDAFQGTMEVDARPGGEFTIASDDGRYYFHGQLTVFDVEIFTRSVYDPEFGAWRTDYIMEPVTRIQ